MNNNLKPEDDKIHSSGQTSTSRELCSIRYLKYFLHIWVTVEKCRDPPKTHTQNSKHFFRRGGSQLFSNTRVGGNRSNPRMCLFKNLLKELKRVFFFFWEDPMFVAENPLLFWPLEGRSSPIMSIHSTKYQTHKWKRTNNKLLLKTLDHNNWLLSRTYKLWNHVLKVILTLLNNYRKPVRLMQQKKKK